MTRAANEFDWLEARPPAAARPFRPPAPEPLARPLGPLELVATLRRNPLEAWTQAHFDEPVVIQKYLLGHVATVSDPAAIRRVLLENAANYQKDTLQKRILANGLAGGLLTAENDQWRTQRRTLAPLFARRSVDAFAPAMREAARDLVARWRALPDGSVIDVAAEMTRLTLDVLVRTIFSEGLGGDPEEMRRAMRVYFDTIGLIDPFDVLGLPAWLPRVTRLRARRTLAYFDRAVETIIATRRARLARDPSDSPRDILGLLLDALDPETGRGLSEEEVRANIITFIAAGHETTSNALTWSTYLLSRAPEWREAVAAEAERELDGATDGLVDRLAMGGAVLDESLRLYPPLVAMSRQAIAADELAGHAIEPGMMVVIAPWVLHRQPRLWSDPDLFDPTRFLPGRREAIDRYAWLPFGAGPRVCIGAAFARQEALIVLGEISRDFVLEMAPGHEPRPIQRLTLRPADGLPMIARRRR